MRSYTTKMLFYLNYDDCKLIHNYTCSEMESLKDTSLVFQIRKIYGSQDIEM